MLPLIEGEKSSMSWSSEICMSPAMGLSFTPLYKWRKSDFVIIEGKIAFFLFMKGCRLDGHG